MSGSFRLATLYLQICTALGFHPFATLTVSQSFWRQFAKSVAFKINCEAEKLPPGQDGLRVWLEPMEPDIAVIVRKNCVQLQASAVGIVVNIQATVVARL